MDELSRRCSRFEQLATETQTKLENSEHRREEFANVSQTLKSSLSESQRCLEEFVDVLNS
eukprot:m.148307 g.148307  ORF g.148307 m.148307 type:complete len:60 (+) comp38495_c0_seq9:399-578(+)